MVIPYVLLAIFTVIFTRPSHQSYERSSNDDDCNWIYVPGIVVGTLWILAIQSSPLPCYVGTGIITIPHRGGNWVQIGWEEVQGAHPGSLAPQRLPLPCVLCRRTIPRGRLWVLEEEAAQRATGLWRASPRAAFRTSKFISSDRAIGSAPMMSFSRGTPSGSFSPSDPSGQSFSWVWGGSTSVSQLGNRRGVWWPGLGVEWGQSPFLVHGYFPIEFEPGHRDFRLKLVLAAKSRLAGV